MAAEPEVTITMEKNPALDGEVLIRAVLVDKGGNVVRVLGTRALDEDDVADKGHAAVREESLAWANELYATKGKEPRPDVHKRKTSSQ